MSENPQKMQGICMARIGLQNLLVKPLRFIEPAGLVMPQGGFEYRLNTRRRFLTQISSRSAAP